MGGQHLEVCMEHMMYWKSFIKLVLVGWWISIKVVFFSSIPSWWEKINMNTWNYDCVMASSSSAAAATTNQNTTTYHHSNKNSNYNCNHNDPHPSQHLNNWRMIGCLLLLCSCSQYHSCFFAWCDPSKGRNRFGIFDSSTTRYDLSVSVFMKVVTRV